MNDNFLFPIGAGIYPALECNFDNRSQYLSYCPVGDTSTNLLDFVGFWVTFKMDEGYDPEIDHFTGGSNEFELEIFC